MFGYIYEGRKREKKSKVGMGNGEELMFLWHTGSENNSTEKLTGN
jgi:hypothetical protein